MTSATPAPRQLLPRAERRAAILRAAASAFTHQGFAGTSMEDVAAAAGITKLIVYRHFASKEELYEAVLRRVSDRLTDEFIKAVESGTTRGVAARSLLTVAREEPDGFVLLWRHAAREPQFAEHAERFTAQAVALASALLVSRGVTDDVRRRWAAQLVVSWAVDGVIHWIEEAPPERDDELLDLLSDGLAAMVRAWAEDGRSHPTG